VGDDRLELPTSCL